jgi:DNA-directed RNA polymerase specialized sigma24 family protein
METSHALALVYDTSYRRLVAQLYAYSGSQQEAEDAVQEAFVKAIQQGDRWLRVGNPEAWLRTVALNHVRNHFRHLNIVRRLSRQVPGAREEMEARAGPRRPRRGATTAQAGPASGRRAALRRRPAGQCCRGRAADLVEHPDAVVLWSIDAGDGETRLAGLPADDADGWIVAWFRCGDRVTTVTRRTAGPNKVRLRSGCAVTT